MLVPLTLLPGGYYIAGAGSITAPLAHIAQHCPLARHRLKTVRTRGANLPLNDGF